MKRYKVYDLQGGDFMGWTHEMPQTKNQIMGYLYSLANDIKTDDDDKWTWHNFRHNFKNDELCNEWYIKLEEVKERR